MSQKSHIRGYLIEPILRDSAQYKDRIMVGRLPQLRIKPVKKAPGQTIPCPVKIIR